MTDDHRDMSLEQLQQWMLHWITHPRGVEADVESPHQGANEIDAVIEPSRALGSEARLGVYANAYYARLLECMRNTFPALVDAIGEKAFDALSFGYLQAHPPSSYTLNDLAKQFAHYLERTRPDGDGERVAWSEFVVDLAKLESLFDEVFDGPGTEQQPVELDWVQAIAPEEWAELRLKMAPCLRLAEFRFPVNEYFSRWRKGERPELPDRQPSFLAVTRRDYVVRRYELAKAEYLILSRLAVGSTIEESIESAAAETDDMDQLESTLGRWFERWTKLEFFSGADRFRRRRPRVGGRAD